MKNMCQVEIFAFNLDSFKETIEFKLRSSSIEYST